jgi:D-alanine-D-alanine ligase
LTYNVKRGAAGGGMAADAESEFDSPRTIETIVAALRKAGYAVHLVEATADLPKWFLTHRVDLAFNIAEGVRGEHRESQVPAILESLKVPYTGSNSITLALALDKAKTKQILASEGVPTPAWQVFPSADTALNPRLEFPLIVKPNREGSSKGIWRDSVVGGEAALRRQVARVLEHYRQEALVEEFIDGTELTAGVLGDQALPVLEIDFSSCATSGEYFYSWRMKEFQGDAAKGLAPVRHCPARIDAATAARVQGLAVRAHRALGCADFSRTDIRLRADGTPFVLEINPLPGLSPLDSNFPYMAQAAGLTHPQLIQRIVDLAMLRARHTPAARIRAEGSKVQPQEPSLSSGLAESRRSLRRWTTEGRE